MNQYTTNLKQKIQSFTSFALVTVLLLSLLGFTVSASASVDTSADTNTSLFENENQYSGF